MTKYASVVVPVPLRTEFTYSFETDSVDLLPGMRVMVPFGNRKIQAYVIDVLDSAPSGDFEIKPIIRAIDKEPLFDRKDYELALWM